MHVILGASGHTGSIIANSLLLTGEKVRVLGRDAGRLELALCARRGGGHGQRERYGRAHQSLQRKARPT